MSPRTAEQLGVDTERVVRITVGERSVEALTDLIGDIDAESYAAMHGRIMAQDPATWICSREDCRALVARLTAIGAPARPHALNEATA